MTEVVGRRSHDYLLWSAGHYISLRVRSLGSSTNDFEQAVLILMPFAGLTVVAALVWWQNERDLAPIRKAREAEKK